MIDKLIYLLQELKDNYSKEKMDEVLNCLEEEVILKDFYKEPDKLRNAFNGQNPVFYKTWASQFVEDLNEIPELYCYVWERKLYYLNEDARIVFYEHAKVIAGDTNATDFINGLMELENFKPEIALVHFNRIDDYVADYFIAQCHLELENFENSIKSNLFFLKNFGATMQNVETETGNLKESFAYLIVEYNVHNDLAYAYNRTGDYSKAYRLYEKLLKVFNLDELFSYRHQVKPGEDLFLIDINNMLLSMEKIGRYEEGLELLEFAISKYPFNAELHKLKIKFKEKTSNNALADEIITHVFKPKRPINIAKIESAKLIPKERILEGMIAELIKYSHKVFEKDLEVYQDERSFERQYCISSVNGILDLPLIERKTGVLYFVQVKRNDGTEKVIKKFSKYIDGLKQALPQRKIKGIICLNKIDIRLVTLASTKPDIEVFVWEVNVR